MKRESMGFEETLKIFASIPFDNRINDICCDSGDSIFMEADFHVDPKDLELIEIE